MTNGMYDSNQNNYYAEIPTAYNQTQAYPNNAQINQITPNESHIINAVQQLSTQSNQFYMQSTNIIQNALHENSMLRMTIKNLQQEREAAIEHFSIDFNNMGICITSKGVHTPVGKIKLLSVSEYKICSQNGFNSVLFVRYIDSKDKEQDTIVTTQNLTEKKLVHCFSGFEFICKNKNTANNFLAWYISQIYNDTCLNFIPYYTGFSIFKENDIEKAEFHCNNNSLNYVLLQTCSENIKNNLMISDKKDIGELFDYIQKYLITAEKYLLFALSLCGLFSTILLDIKYPLNQILAISTPNPETTKQVSCYLKTFNRSQAPISFDTNKTKIKKIFHNTKDETIVINDCSIIDNEKRRIEMLQYTLELNNDSETQPHHTAIISEIAQYLIPQNSKICLTISSSFYNKMSSAEEDEMCYALNCLSRYFIDITCEDYTKIKHYLMENIVHWLDYEKCQKLSIQSKTSFAIIKTLTIFINHYLNFKCSEQRTQEIEDLILNALDSNSKANGDSSDAITNDFAYCLNNSIDSGKIKVVLHNKGMNFIPDNPQIIIKDDLLMIEEKIVEQILLPQMNTTNSVHNIIKALENVGLLHSTKKNRYPLTVYNQGESLRVTFIAMELDGVLNSNTILRAKESKYADWFSTDTPDDNLIPIITNKLGEKAYQRFEFDKADNMHCFYIGQSGSGKTLSLTERVCSLFKAGQKVVIFDTSDSFTKSEITEKLSASGDELVKEQVEAFINENVTFHKIEELGVPVDILKLEFPSLAETKRKIIDSIISAHIPNMGKVQKAALRNGINDLILNDNLNMIDMYDRLTDVDKVSDSLVMQFEDMLYCFLEYISSEKSWNEFLNESKGIVVVSTDAISGSGGSALVDMLLMSLFYNQRNNPSQHIAVFIDEIQNQNFSSNGAITQILKEGRKYHISLNYATQFLPSSNKDMLKVINLAALRVFLQPDDISAKALSKTIGVPASDLCLMNQGECYVSGMLYNNVSHSPKNGVIHGFTYRNFIN